MLCEIGIDLEVGQPKIRLGIDDAHHRIGEHVARREMSICYRLGLYQTLRRRRRRYVVVAMSRAE